MDNIPNSLARGPITSVLKLEDTPEQVERLARATRERFVVTTESNDVPMHREKAHLVRRWMTVIVIDETGEITPLP